MTSSLAVGTLRPEPHTHCHTLHPNGIVSMTASPVAAARSVAVVARAVRRALHRLEDTVRPAAARGHEPADPASTDAPVPVPDNSTREILLPGILSDIPASQRARVQARTYMERRRRRLNDDLDSRL